MNWKHLDNPDDEKPNDKEICLLWDYELDYQLATYSKELDAFFGQFHGYNPRWWVRLSRPEEKQNE